MKKLKKKRRQVKFEEKQAATAKENSNKLNDERGKEDRDGLSEEEK
jgi:hypothetical protein